MTRDETNRYVAVSELATAHHPRWVVYWGLGTRQAWAIATFTSHACVLHDADPARLESQMREIEETGVPV